MARQICLAALLVLICCSSFAPQLATAAAIQPAKRHQTAYIAFVNDVHNRLEEEEPLTAIPCQPKTKALGRCVGGWPRISTEIKALRLQAAREGAAFWFLDAGDEFTGSLWDVTYKGAVTPYVQKAVGQDAMVIGNHEFDYGLPALASYIRNLTTCSGSSGGSSSSSSNAGCRPIPVLGACNIDASAEPLLQGLLQKWTVLSFKSKHKTYKVGVLGWSTASTAATAPSVGKLKFLAEAAAVKSCLAELKAKHRHLDYIIGLSHAGYESDQDVATTVPGLDVIIGGHSHTFLYSPTTAGPLVTRQPGATPANCTSMAACDKPVGPYPTWVGNVPIVQAYYSSKYLGLLKVNLDGRQLLPGLQPLLLGGANSSRNVQQDPAILQLLKQYEKPVEALKTTVAGKTLVPLEGAPQISRSNETNLGNYVCEAFLKSVPAAVAAQTGNISICLMVAGGIRTGIENPGNITVAEVLAMLPYANAVAIFTISGQVLLDAVKNGLSLYPNGGRFLQVAGIRYYHKDGAFLSAALLNPDGSSSPIDPKGRYPVVATDYMLQGGDGYSFPSAQGGDGYSFPGAQVLLPAGDPYVDVVLADLKKHPEGISPSTYNRIINCAKFPAFPGCP
uniref:5'-Nucleotidase C-terminal domain-containing protein n=1 Tax=Tetradesmus obliquus TaxID=3088 RepID=A0A383W8U0_TETOB|eukprot:jgi/Sobl393_1/5309/SZX73831.1